MFIVKAKTNWQPDFSLKTEHYFERVNRIIYKRGNWHQTFTIDKGHKNGWEYHVIYDNAIIDIYNVKTKKFVTRLLARPGQIRRYGITNDAIIKIAMENQKQGLNKI